LASRKCTSHPSSHAQCMSQYGCSIHRGSPPPGCHLVHKRCCLVKTLHI
jgi:hypothetical protein